MGNQFTSSTYTLLEQENIVESILFMMGESVSVDTLATAIESTVDVAKDAAERLYNKYQNEYQDRGMKVIKLGSKYQMVSNNKYFKNLVLVASHPQKPVITESILETLSIIAYKQPISKPEIEHIRGVKSDYACNRLLEYGLIEEKGRLETAGRPILFGTTEEFMLRFGIESLDELPILDATKFAEIENEVEKELSESLGEPVVIDKDLYTENITTNLKSDISDINEDENNENVENDTKDATQNDENIQNNENNLNDSNVNDDINVVNKDTEDSSEDKINQNVENKTGDEFNDSLVDVSNDNNDVNDYTVNNNNLDTIDNNDFFDNQNSNDIKGEAPR